MSEPKFCVACRHSFRVHYIDRPTMFFCRRDGYTTDLVTGETIPKRKRFCQEERARKAADSCGPDARYFEGEIPPSGPWPNPQPDAIDRDAISEAMRRVWNR